MQADAQAQIIHAIQCILSPETANNVRRDAEKWLGGILDAPGGWAIINWLLETDKQPEVRQYGASMFKRKVMRESASLDQTAAIKVTDALFSRFLQESVSTVRSQLGTSLALMLSSFPSDNTVPMIIDRLGQKPCSLMQLLILLSDETGGADSSQLEAALKLGADSVIQLLGVYAMRNQTPISQIVRCFSALVCFIDSANLLKSPFLDLIFNPSNLVGTDPDVMEACNGAVRQICMCDDHVLLVPRLASLVPILIDKASLDTVAHTLALIGTTSALHIVEECCKSPNPQQLLLVSTMVNCITHVDPTTAESTFSFWHALRNAVRGINEAQRDVAIGVLKPYLEQALQALLQYSILPASEAEWGSFDAHRHDVAAPVFIDLAQTLMMSRYLSFMAATLTEKQYPNWKELEVRLYAMACLGVSASLDAWATVAPALLSAYVSLTYVEQHAKMRATFVTILPRLSEYLSENPPALKSAIEASGAMLSHKGGQALLRICVSCRRTIVGNAAEFVPLLMNIFNSCDQLPAEEQAAVAEGLGVVAWSLPEEMVPNVVNELVGKLMTRCTAAFSQSQVVVLGGGLAALCSLLQTAAKWCQEAQMDGVSSQPTAVGSAWSSVWDTLWGLLSKCLSIEPLAEQACKCFSGLVKVASDKLSQASLTSLAAAVTEEFRTKPNVAYLQLVGDIVETHASIEANKAVMTKAVKDMGQVGITLLQAKEGQPGFADVEVCKGVFKMLGSAVKRSVVFEGKRHKSVVAPAVVAEVGQEMLGVAMHALKSEVVIDTETVKLLLVFVESFVGVDGAKQLLHAGVGPQLFSALLFACSTKSSDALPPLTKAISSLKLCARQAFPAWTQEALTHITTIPDEAKATFLAAVTNGVPSVKLAVDQLHRVAKSRTALL